MPAGERRAELSMGTPWVRLAAGRKGLLSVKCLLCTIPAKLSPVFLLNAYQCPRSRHLCLTSAQRREWRCREVMPLRHTATEPE